MLKRWFWRWRYQRLPDKLYDSSVKNLTLLTRYCRFAQCLSFNTSDYRTRIQYQLLTKTAHIGELEELTETIYRLVKVNSHHVDHLHISYKPRIPKRLDIYLTDHEQRPVDETDAIERLLHGVSRVVDELERINKNKPSLYAYYNQSMHYYIGDVVGVLDAFISMQLGVRDGRRHAPDLIAGR